MVKRMKSRGTAAPVRKRLFLPPFPAVFLAQIFIFLAPHPAQARAAGLDGGFPGSSLFRALGAGKGWGDAGRGGTGIWEMLLILGIIYFLYRFMVNKRESGESGRTPYTPTNSREPAPGQPTPQASLSPAAGSKPGTAHVRRFDPAFDRQDFRAQVPELFFNIRNTWSNRDIVASGPLLTSEVQRIFQEEIDRLLREQGGDRPENITVRQVEIVEAWQESEQDFITMLTEIDIFAYTPDDSIGKTSREIDPEPIRLEEHWTLTRPAGNNPWRLSAVGRK